MKSKFWLSLICDKKTGKLALSKGNIMCWISFFGLLAAIFFEIKGAKVSNNAFETLRYIFTTTFVYSGFKKGSDVLKEVKISDKGINSKVKK